MNRIWIRARSLGAWAGAAALSIGASAFGQAGGFFLPENGGPASGTAMAGQAAIARDAQTAWLNPAGMTRLESPEIMLAVMPFRLVAEFNPASNNAIPGGDGGDQGGWFPAGGLFLAAPVSERLAFGFSVTSPAGLILDPDDDWVGRTWVTRAELLVLNFQPSIGFAITDQFSIGAGLDIQYASLEQSFGLPGGGGPGPIGGGTSTVDGDSWNVGFSVSLLWEPADDLRLGLRYRSAVNHNLDGNLTIQNGQRASTNLDLPQSVTFSAYHDINDQVAFVGDLGWTNWSAFDRTVVNTDVIDATIPRNWKDTWNIGVGLHLRPVDKWLVMLGFSYVSSSVDDEDRTPDLIADQQFRVSTGVEYNVTDTIRVGGTFTYANLGANSIDQDRGPGRLVGDYDADAFIIGLYAAFQF